MVTEVQLRIGNHVVQTPTDDAKGHRPDRNISNGARGPTTGHITTVAKPDRDDNAENDHQCVRTNGDRSQIPDPR